MALKSEVVDPMIRAVSKQAENRTMNYATFHRLPSTFAHVLVGVQSEARSLWVFRLLPDRS